MAAPAELHTTSKNGPTVVSQIHNPDNQNGSTVPTDGQVGRNPAAEKTIATAAGKIGLWRNPA